MEDDFYNILADYYDCLQEGLDPEAWALYIDALAKKHCTSSGEGENGFILVDLGCGSGAITSVLAENYGYETIGVDRSECMLDMARERSGDVLWLNQDITDYELFGAADVFISTLDTVNHILEPDDIGKIFKSFANYMAPGGVFIFDAGTRKHFEETLGNNTFFQDYDDFTLLWDNSYDEEEGISTSSMTLFYSEDGGETYARVDGEIIEKYYPDVLFSHLGNKYGMKLEAVYGELSFDAPTADDERQFFVFRKI
ncbi:MAG: methyltransferase domain-containing protein [Saccharofermentans sp.]|nr:methyltransferase domain-containing protein [Saccharofermentans sp.]